jgi:hypothetical protein
MPFKQLLPVVLKVYAYILDIFADGDRLLVFEHVDFPEAGIQMPGGRVEPGETLTAAVSDKQINQQNNSHCHQDLGGKVHTGPPFLSFTSRSLLKKILIS